MEALRHRGEKGSTRRPEECGGKGRSIASVYLGRSPGKERVMLYTIAVVMLVLWLLGLVSGYTIGAFIHVLLVVAIVLFLVGMINGRRIA
jgi:hypothetical protein